MCFSASASFSAGIFLSVIGLLSLRKAPRAYLPFAAIPLMFGIQQVAEGFVWLLVNVEPPHIFEPVMVYTFLFFAFVVWPTWIPFSTYLLERKNSSKKNLGYLLALGTMVSTIVLASLVFRGATAQSIGCHIVYTIPNFIPMPNFLGLLFYACATILPFFIITLPGASFIGGLIALSCILSWFVWYAAFTSVWCFFAAILSIFIFMFIPHKNETPRP